jgi:diguanylate cyclase (GGDEF)-like protein/PAS domain S-box-containing protein
MNKKDKQIKKVKCWDVFICEEPECPAYKSRNLSCWLFSGTHCRNEIQGKFLEKMEMCLGCEVFTANMDVSAMNKTIRTADDQFKEFRQIVEDRDRELENIGLELSIGLSETFEALKRISSGDPTVRLDEKSGNELIARLKHLVNLTAENIGEIVNQSHEFAMDLAEHFEVLHKVSMGNLNARVTGGTQIELSQALQKVTNDMIENISREINERKRAEEEVREAEQKFRNIIEHSNELFYIHDTLHKLTFISPQSIQILGYYPDEMMIEWTNLITENPINQIGIDLTEKAIRTGERQRPYLLELYRKDKNKVLLEIDESPIKDSDGKIIGIVGAARDVTDHKKAEEALRKSEERYRSFVKNFQGIAFREKLDSTPVFFHGAVEQITGYTEEELLAGQPGWDQIIHPDDIPRITVKEKLRLVPNYSEEREYRIINKNGEIRWVHEVIRNILDKSGKPFRIEGAIYDATERKQAQQQIIHMAYHDSLTNLPNRYLLKDRLRQALAAAKNYNRLVATLFLDLDNFKHINDTLGHDAGDELLKNVAERIVKYTRKSDTFARLGKNESGTTVARLGGDEFTILLTEIKNIQDAAKVAQRILNLFSKPFGIKGQDLFVTTSIGISLYPHDGDNADTLLKNADTAMYHAKEQGRNNFQFYTESMKIVALERFALENDLRKALDRNEFQLYYQPQIDIQSGKVIGVETLIRWLHPKKGLLMPLTFMPLAEETNLIVPIGKWVLYSACAQNKAWQEANFPPMYVTVNISGTQFRQKNFAETVARALTDTGLDPQYLELELKESILMGKPEVTTTTLSELKAMGIRLSIDDFGTGYSSLSYLKRFSMDTLKIHRSFVKNLLTNHYDKAIISAIIAIARSLNVKIIAAGVETVQQLSILREQGSDCIQGFLFSQPLPNDALTQLLKEGKCLNSQGLSI